MNKVYIGGAIYLGIFLISLMVGGMMAGYMFFAAIKFAALVAAIETIRPLRSIAYSLGSFFDFLLLAGSFVLMFTAGVTIGVSFTVTALMWTILYRPYIKYRLDKAKLEEWNRKQRLQ